MLERIRVKNFILFSLLLFLVTGISLICRAEEAALKEKSPKAKETEVKTIVEKAALMLGARSENRVNIDLTNNVPVRGMQFVISGVKMTEVRTTSRTSGFLAKFSEKNGVVILVSSSGDSIAAGVGPVAEVVCDKPGSAILSGVKIAGDKRQPLKSD